MVKKNPGSEEKTKPAQRAEIMFDLADSIAKAGQEGRSTNYLQRGLKNFIKEEKIEFLLSDSAVNIKLSPRKDSAKITINDSKISPDLRYQKLKEIAESILEVL